jgi:hypothetical protein
VPTRSGSGSWPSPMAHRPRSCKGIEYTLPGTEPTSERRQAAGGHHSKSGLWREWLSPLSTTRPIRLLPRRLYSAYVGGSRGTALCLSCLCNPVDPKSQPRRLQVAECLDSWDGLLPIIRLRSCANRLSALVRHILFTTLPRMSGYGRG